MHNATILDVVAARQWTDGQNDTHGTLLLLLVSISCYLLARIVQEGSLAPLAKRGRQFKLALHTAFYTYLTRPICQLARSLVLQVFGKITEGQLYVLDQYGCVIGMFGNGHGHRCTLQVRDELFWLRTALKGDMGFAEAFMDEQVDIDDPVAFVKLFLANRHQLQDGQTVMSRVGEAVSDVFNSRLVNSLQMAIFNIQAHYDIGNELFTSFLDHTTQYSSAYFSDVKSALAESPHSQDLLVEAQLVKVHALVDRCALRSGDHLLEIGTGWGTLAIEAAKRTGCRVTTLTLSEEQKEMAEERIRDAGLSDHITVLLCDYRNLPVPAEPYDAIVACEMLEHVGHEHMATFFRICDRMLHPQHGILVTQQSTISEGRYESYRRRIDFIQRYIFPGGLCPTVTSMVDACHTGSQGELVLDALENRPEDYAFTLRLWRERFLYNYNALDKVAQMAGIYKYNESFRRRWIWYLAYCEGGFATRTLQLTMLQYTRSANPRLLKYADVC